jgi:hypothetical protein
MAAFHSIIYGRFWVITKALIAYTGRGKVNARMPLRAKRTEGRLGRRAILMGDSSHSGHTSGRAQTEGSAILAMPLSRRLIPTNVPINHSRTTAIGICAYCPLISSLFFNSPILFIVFSYSNRDETVAASW